MALEFLFELGEFAGLFGDDLVEAFGEVLEVGNGGFKASEAFGQFVVHARSFGGGRGEASLGWMERAARAINREWNGQ